MNRHAAGPAATPARETTDIPRRAGRTKGPDECQLSFDLPAGDLPVRASRKLIGDDAEEQALRSKQRTRHQIVDDWFADMLVDCLAEALGPARAIDRALFRRLVFRLADRLTVRGLASEDVVGSLLAAWQHFMWSADLPRLMRAGEKALFARLGADADWVVKEQIYLDANDDGTPREEWVIRPGNAPRWSPDHRSPRAPNPMGRRHVEGG